MKFAILAVAIISILPLCLLARRHDPVFKTIWFCLGCFPFLLSAVPLFDIGIAALPGEWIGFVHGVEVSAVDFVAILCFLSLKRPKPAFWSVVPLALYILVASASMYQASEPFAAFYGVWQLMRVLFVAFVVASAFEDPRIPFLILKGMSVGMAANAVASIWQHFGLGLAQSPGLFMHQNTLGMIAHFVLYPHLALLLSTRRESTYLTLTVLCCLLVIVLTASRATVGLAMLGIGITYVVIALSGMTQRLVGVAMAGLVCALLLAPLAISAFSSRFDQSPLSENVYDERAAFNRAAMFIYQDHPFGVGINHYVSVAKGGGYVERAGVAANESNRSNIVHNAYWLAAAETGFIGFLSFSLLLLVPILVALRAAFSIPYSTYRTLLCGYAVALVVASIHSTLEWIIFIKDVQYVLALTIGSIWLVARQSEHRHQAIAPFRSLLPALRPHGKSRTRFG